jgi:hypothetical protein
MAKAKTPRVAKPRTSKNVLQMPENGTNGNGFSPVDVETEIRLRAYEIYEQRGSTPGDETEDWLAAEREVLARHAQHSRTA